MAINQENFEALVSIIDNLEIDQFTHAQIAKIIESKSLPFNQKTNWKESWLLLNHLVKLGLINKHNKIYTKNG